MLSDYNKISSSTSTCSYLSINSSRGFDSGYVITLDEDPISLSQEVQKKILSNAYAMVRGQRGYDGEHSANHYEDACNSQGRDDVDDMDLSIDFKEGRVGPTNTTNEVFDNQIITQTLTANSHNDFDDDMDTPLILPVSKSPNERVQRVKSGSHSSSSSSSPKSSGKRQCGNKEAFIFYQEEEEEEEETCQVNERSVSENYNSPLILSHNCNRKKKMNFLQRLSNIASRRKNKKTSRSKSKGSLACDIMMVTEELDINFERRESEMVTTPFGLDVSIISESSVESDNDIEIDPSSNGFCFDAADGFGMY